MGIPAHGSLTLMGDVSDSAGTPPRAKMPARPAPPCDKLRPASIFDRSNAGKEEICAATCGQALFVL